MAISQLDRRRIELLLTEYCDRVPERVRDQLRHSFTIGPTSVDLFEERPAFCNPSEWRRHPVAKFRFIATREQWALYCRHSDLKWHSYRLLPQAGAFEILLREVQRDPSGVFWG